MNINRVITDTVTRRKLLRGGLIGGGAAVLAACGETTEIIREVPVEVIKEVQVPGATVVKEVIKEVPVEVEVERIVEVEVPVEKTVEVEVPVESVLVVNDPWGVVTVEPGDTIKIGLVTVLAGDLANLGIDIRNGAELAFDDFPEVKGFGVEMLDEDGQCSGEGGTAVANKLAANTQVVAVVGHMCSGSSEPASLIYERAHIPMVSPSSTAVSFTGRGLEVTNRVCWNDRIQGTAAAEFAMNTLGAEKAALIHDQSSYGEGLVKVFQGAFEELGGETTAFEGITVGDKDFRAVLTTIADGAPDLIYFGGFQAEGALLVSQKNEVGLDGAIFMGADGINSQVYIDSAAGDAEGSYSSFADFGEADEDLLNSFLERYAEKFGEPQGPFHAHAYDAAAIIIDAIDTGSQLTADGKLLILRKAINDAIRANQGYQGVSGVISFASNGDGGQGTVGFQVVANDAWDSA